MNQSWHKSVLTISLALPHSQDYTPEISQTVRIIGSDSYLLELDGTVHCDLDGCYEDKSDYVEWLIPVTSFSCLPPVIPTSIEMLNIRQDISQMG